MSEQIVQIARQPQPLIYHRLVGQLFTCGVQFSQRV